MVISFEGIDGSGKSSIAFALSERLTVCGLRVAYVPTRGDGLVADEGVSPSVVEHLDALSHLIWSGSDADHHHELGYEHWLQLVGGYFGGLMNGVIAPLRTEHDIIIVESWYHKFAAKLRIKGVSDERLQCMLPAAQPDRIFLIDTPAALAWAQKRTFSFVELGGQDGYAELGRDSFIDYQGRIRADLLARAVDYGWTVLDNGPAATTESICEQIEASLGLSEAKGAAQ